VPYVEAFSIGVSLHSWTILTIPFLFLLFFVLAYLLLALIFLCSWLAYCTVSMSLVFLYYNRLMISFRERPYPKRFFVWGVSLSLSQQSHTWPCCSCVIYRVSFVVLESSLVPPYFYYFLFPCLFDCLFALFVLLYCLLHNIFPGSRRRRRTRRHIIHPFSNFGWYIRIIGIIKS